jgi:hypothetical protein
MLRTLDPLRAELSALAEEQLEAEITLFAGHIYAAACRWLLLVGEFDRREGWRSWECTSTASWLSWQCGIDPMTAREQVRVGRALAGLPKIKQAFGSGELSYSKVRALSRVATAETEETLVIIARHTTAAQLERLARAYRTVRQREGLEEANDRHARRYARYYFDEDGSFVMSLRLSPEEGALVAKALEAAKDEVRKARRREKSVSAETPPEEADDPPAPTMADAVVAMAEAALPGEVAVRSGGDRYQVVVHVDVDTLVGDGGRSEVEDAANVAPETARRIACDAGLLVALHGADGRLLTVGRKTRSIPPWIRRGLHHRDHGCRFPGCDLRVFIEAHHIHHWGDGGETSLDNLVELCWFHHRMLHEGGFKIERGESGDPVFCSPKGMPIEAVPSEAPPEGDVMSNLAAMGVGVEPRACVPNWSGGRMNLGHIINLLSDSETRKKPGAAAARGLSSPRR